MTRAKHLKLELGMRLLTLACLFAMAIAPVIALFERDWLYGSMLAVPIVFGSLPRRIRPWRREERVRVQFLYAYAVGFIGLGTGHVWLAVAGVFVPNLIILALGWFIRLAPQLCAPPDDAAPEQSPPSRTV